MLPFKKKKIFISQILGRKQREISVVILKMISWWGYLQMCVKVKSPKKGHWCTSELRGGAVVPLDLKVQAGAPKSQSGYRASRALAHAVVSGAWSPGRPKGQCFWMKPKSRARQRVQTNAIVWRELEENWKHGRLWEIEFGHFISIVMWQESCRDVLSLWRIGIVNIYGMTAACPVVTERIKQVWTWSVRS